MNTPTYDQILKAYNNKGYTYFGGTVPYNLNIWGIRKQFGNIDLFDDVLGISYLDETGTEKIYMHQSTVDPGKYYLVTKLGNPNGTFILAPGQYRGCWHTGQHGKTKYAALVQKPGYGLFKGWRDKVLNGRLDRLLDQNGDFFQDVVGLNMHRSNTSYAALVGQYSAGCQVRQYHSSHLRVMEIVQRSLKDFPDSFSYTLFDEEDVFPEVTSRDLTRSSGVQSAQKKWPDDYMNVEK
ncbi:MAG: hypothetical protein WBO36_00565 [Saprospiraceae bacterium]